MAVAEELNQGQPEPTVTPPVTPEPVAAPAGATPPPIAPEGGEAKTPAEPTFEELAAKAKLADKYERQIKHLTGVLKQTKDQNQELRRAPASVVSTPVAPPAKEPTAPEDVDNLQATEDGTVLYKGQQWDREVLRMRLELDQTRQENAQFREALDGRTAEEAEAAEEKDRADLQTALHSGVRDLRVQVLPQFKGENGELVDAYAEDRLEGILRRAFTDDHITFQDLTPELAYKYMLQAVRDTATMMSIPVETQAAANEEHRKEHQIKTKGAPALPAGVKSWFEMKKLPVHEQNRIILEAERNATANP